VTSALEVNFNAMRSINSRFTYLLTYLLNSNSHVNVYGAVIMALSQREFTQFI